MAVVGVSTDVHQTPSPSATEHVGSADRSSFFDAVTDTGRNGVIALSRARILVVAIGFVTLGAAAGAIFDRFDWALVVAPTFPAVAAVLLVSRSDGARLAAAAVSIVAAVALTVVVAGGSFADLTGSFTSGVQGLLSTDWPSPLQPQLLGTVAAVLATACAASAELASRRRFHLSALLPLLGIYLCIVALSSPAPVRWGPLVMLAVVATVFAMLRSGATLAERIVLLRGERRVIPLVGGAVVLVVLAAIPISLESRANPRRNDPATQSAPLLDPIEATLALRRLDPAIDLHVIESADDAPLPVRWRTAALTSYDGRRWSPSLILRPIGFTLGTAAGPTIDARVTFVDDNLSLVPLPGAPIRVEAAVETDADRTVVRLARRPDAGEVVRVVADAPPTASDAVTVGIMPRVVDESSSGLAQLADGLAGDGTDIERLSRLETTMRTDFVLDNEVQGGGLEQALIDRFLRDTRRGTSEQFATAFVMLVRSLGLEARVATGFVAGADSDPPPTVSPPGVPLTLSSADAATWPEVELLDGRWVAYDPVPPEEAADGAPPPPEPQVQSPAAPQPPVEPPPEADSESTTADDTPAAESRSILSTAITWVVRGAATLSLVVLPFLIAAALIVGLKYRRRKRRLEAADPIDRIRGAWGSATDALVDAGLDISASATDAEIAGDGRPFAAGAQLELRRLAVMSGAATYGTPRHTDLLADDAASCLHSVERAVLHDRSWRQRWRWRLSVRSLRRSTRSPVTD